MKLAILAFTRAGSAYARQIQKMMTEKGHSCEAGAKGKKAKEWGFPVEERTLREWTKSAFREADALLFIGAAGIAVRAIAPFVMDKSSDPAVLCMDEQGRFVISLLSGHLGGANELTREIADLCGAVPVITTATDSGGRFSVDDFARRENLSLDSLKLAKKIAADILENHTIGFSSDFEIEGSIPPELSLEKRYGTGISISLDDRKNPFPETLHLVPRVLVLGIGCRRGTKKEAIEELVRKVLREHHLSEHSVAKAASIDLKKDEPGLREFCRDWQIPLFTYSAQELLDTESDESFEESEFVKKTTGVGNVCGRSAVKASGSRRLLVAKTAENGVTVAAAQEEYTVKFR